MFDVLLPQRCLVCGAGGAQLCASCSTTFPRIEPPLCERCGAPTAWPVARCRECSGRRLAFATARAAVAYDDGVRRLVAAWKERGLRRLAEDAADIVVTCLPPPAAEWVTFVPADRGRRRERGHHPVERLAGALSARWGLECAPLLERTRPSRRQRGLTVAERRRNVAGAFVARSTSGAVLLVDDVYTTGSTVSAAASALRAAGARNVDVVTFARAVRFRGAT